MNSTDISDKHYKLIGVSEGCSWKELRKSYKLQIQKFHPDRYEADSILKFDAEEHIKSLNLAYRYFQAYYKEHGSLPVKRRPAIVGATSPPDSRPFKFKPEDTQDIFYSPPSVKKKKFRLVYTVALITSTFILFALYITPSSTERKLVPSKKQAAHVLNATQTDANTTLNHKSDRTYTKSSVASLQHKNRHSFSKPSISVSDSLFSYGSSMGKVIDAQGIPDRSVNDTWYYGKSVVYFKDGVVSSWEIHIDSPLNTTISLKTESYRNISTEP